MSSELSNIIAHLFRGREDHIAVGDTSGAFHPEQTPLTAERIEQHLTGAQCFGFYLMREDSTVYASCLDFDSKPDRPDERWRDKAETVWYFLTNAGLCPIVEVSQSGEGCHVWLFFSAPVDAWLIRAFWSAVCAKNNIAPPPEIYPRQDRLSGKGLGNLVRLPLWNRSHFADIEGDWKEHDPAAVLSAVSRTEATALRLIAWELGFGELRPATSATIESEGTITGLSGRVRTRLSKSHSLLARRWFGDTSGLQDPSRSALVLSIACELVRTYVPTPEIESAIRYWCDQFGYEKGEREGWVQDTVRKAYDFVLTRVEAKSASGTTVKQACFDYLDRIASGAPLHIGSGVPDFDRSVGGIGFGEVAIIAARPGHGKSAFGLQWVDAASANGVCCLVLSEEMGRLEIGRRAILSLSSIDELDWRDNLQEMKAAVVRHYADREPIHLVETCGTIDRAEELIDQYCGIHGVGLVAVDYLQLLGARSGKRYDDVTEVSRRLAQAARRNNCAMLVMCQLNREIEKRVGYVPKNSDLRESGQIEQDADLIAFVQWPLKFDPTYRDVNEYRIYITKRRNGSINQPLITTTFQPNRQQIGMFGSGVGDAMRDGRMAAVSDGFDPFRPDEWQG